MGLERRAETMTYVGIDPGLGGAVAWIEMSCFHAHVVPTPTMAKGKSGRQYDMPACWDLLNKIRLENQPSGWTFICLELAQAMPPSVQGRAQGLVSSFNTGSGWGFWQGLLTALPQCRWQIVHPRTWQKLILAGVPHAKGETKSASILVAKRLFGGVSLKRTDKCRKDCDGMSDALLLAEHGRRIHSGKEE